MQPEDCVPATVRFRAVSRDATPDRGYSRPIGHGTGEAFGGVRPAVPVQMVWYNACVVKVPSQSLTLGPLLRWESLTLVTTSQKIMPRHLHYMSDFNVGTANDLFAAGKAGVKNGGSRKGRWP